MDYSSLSEGFLGQKMIVLPNALKKELATNTVTRFFLITDIGYYPNANNHYRKRLLGAKEYIFAYCTDGSGKLRYQGRTRDILPNTFFIIPKNEKHEYWADNANPWSIYWMHFDGTAAKHLYDRYAKHADVGALIPFKKEKIDSFNQIFEIFKSDYVPTGMEYANILGLNFLSSFIYNNIEMGFGDASPSNVIDEIIVFLSENLDKSFKAEDISKKFNYSSSYLFSLFKQKTGYSLIHFFNLKKVQKACEYLSYTDLSIKEIAFLLGFQDPLYFSRLFKKYMGSSPKAYKKNYRS